MKKKILYLVIMLGIVFFPTMIVNAAGLSVSASSTSIVNGGTVKVTVNASGIAGKFSVTSSNGKVLSGGTNGEWLENESKSYTFTAKSVGSATITVTPINAAYSDGSGKVTSGKSITINVVKPREKSTNNNLSKLEVEGYTLEPSFNKDTLEYNIKIETNVEKVKINASLEDKYASLSGTGEKEVSEGDNKLEVVVTSETGVSKTYVLTINVKDNNPIIKEVDGKNYTVVKRANLLTLPDSLNKDLFKLETTKIDDVDIPIYTSEELSLIGLKGEDGNIYLYKLVNNEITEKYEDLVSKGIILVLTNPKDVLEGYTKSNLVINGKEYTIYKNDKNTLVYGTNLETNESNWYRYDEKENTLQIYDDSLEKEFALKEKELNDKVSLYEKVIIGLGALSFILFLAFVFKKGKKKDKPQKEEKPIEKIEVKEEVKEDIKEEPVKKDIAKKIDKKNKKEEVKEEKKFDTKELEKIVEEEIKSYEKETTDTNIPNFAEIEEDINGPKKEEVKEEKVEESDEEELMDPYDFLDIKKKRRRK